MCVIYIERLAKVTLMLGPSWSLICIVLLFFIYFSEVTDVGVSALLNNCNNLRCAVFSGLKQLTIAPFVRLISGDHSFV